ARGQDALADVAPLSDEAVRVGCTVEREGLGHDWLQLTALQLAYQRLNHPIERSLGVPPGEHVEAEHALVLVQRPQPLPPRHRCEGALGKGPQRCWDAALLSGVQLRGPVHDQSCTWAKQPVVLPEA